MAITKDKLASVLVFCIVAVLAINLFQPLAIPAIGLYVGLIVSCFGLALIWLAEPLGEIGCFSRGIALRSPPAMIEAFGWLFMVGYPIIVLLAVR